MLLSQLSENTLSDRLKLCVLLLYRPCSGLILTVASKNDVDDTAAETYLKNGIKEYEKYKKFNQINGMIDDKDFYYKGNFFFMYT